MERPLGEFLDQAHSGNLHNGADPTQYFHLPIGRTVVVGAQVFFF